MSKYIQYTGFKIFKGKRGMHAWGQQGQEGVGAEREWKGEGMQQVERRSYKMGGIL